MKKAIKIIIGILVVCAGVAGGLFLYNKIKEKQSAIDDDFEDDFEDDEDDTISREYVDINAN